MKKMKDEEIQKYYKRMGGTLIAMMPTFLLILFATIYLGNKIDKIDKKINATNREIKKVSLGMTTKKLTKKDIENFERTREAIYGTGVADED